MMFFNECLCVRMCACAHVHNHMCVTLALKDNHPKKGGGLHMIRSGKLYTGKLYTETNMVSGYRSI